MAGSSKEGRVTKVLLRQAETNKEYSCELDVNPDTIVDGGGQVLKDATFGFVQNCVESDQELSEQQRKKLHFIPEPLEENTEDESSSLNEEGNKRQIVMLVEALQKYAKEAEDKVTQDPMIKSVTNKILSDCVKKKESGVDETDSEETGLLKLDLRMLWSQISELFRIFFAELKDPDGMTLQ